MHVLELSSLGSPIPEIADYLKVSQHWLRHRLDTEHDDFDEVVFAVYNNGTGEFRKRLRQAQQNLAEVSAPMAIHLGKTYLGQREKVEVEHNHVHVVGTLPDYAQTPEQWRAQFGPQSSQAALPQPHHLEAEDAEFEDAPE